MAPLEKVRSLVSKPIKARSVLTSVPRLAHCASGVKVCQATGHSGLLVPVANMSTYSSTADVLGHDTIAAYPQGPLGKLHPKRIFLKEAIRSRDVANEDLTCLIFHYKQFDIGTPLPAYAQRTSRASRAESRKVSAQMGVNVMGFSLIPTSFCKREP